MAFQLCTKRELYVLHSQKYLSSTAIINENFIPKGIYLCRNVSMVSYNSAILELI